MKKIIIIIIAIVILVSTGFIILFTNHDYSETYSEVVEIQGKVIEFDKLVKEWDYPIIIVRDDNKQICAVRYYDVINRFDETMVSVCGDFGYAWLDVRSRIKYNNWLLWCKAYNGRYIIIDHVNNHVFITLSYFQMKIGAVFLLLIVIIIILSVKIKRLQIKKAA